MKEDIKRTITSLAGGAVVLTLLGTGIGWAVSHATKRTDQVDSLKGDDKERFKHKRHIDLISDQEGCIIDNSNKDGRNEYDYDENGYDAEGFNRLGRDAEGYDRNGFSRDGYNRDGVDRQGYGRDYYNYAGVDRVGCCRQSYALYLERLREMWKEAYMQMQFKQYRYALDDARRVFEETLRVIVRHALGQDKVGESMHENLKICEQNNLLCNETINNLHGVRKLCNTNIHVFGSDEQLNHNKVHFVIMQVKELLKEAENLLVYI